MNVGGAEKVFLRDMQHMLSLGNDVYCVLFSYERSLNNLLSEINLPENHVFVLRKMSRHFFLAPDFFYDVANKAINIIRIFWFLYKFKVDVVYATLDKPVLISKIASWLMPSARFFTREAAIPVNRSRFSYVALDFLGLKVTKCIAVSESVKSSLLQYSWIAKNKIVVLKNSVPHSEIASDCFKPTKYIVFTGSFKPIKMHTVLIVAFSRLIAQYPGLKLLLIGDGYLEEKLVHQVNNLGLVSNVEFMGCQNRDVLFNIYSKSVIFVMPSENEGCPNALLEAMSCGVPCVGSDAPGIVEVLDGGRCGNIFPRNNPEMLTNMLSELLSSPTERHRLGSAAQCHVREKYSDHEHFKHLQELLTGVII